jgi:hypothetical protein
MELEGAQTRTAQRVDFAGHRVPADVKPGAELPRAGTVEPADGRERVVEADSDAGAEQLDLTLRALVRTGNPSIPLST